MAWRGRRPGRGVFRRMRGARSSRRGYRAQCLKRGVERSGSLSGGSCAQCLMEERLREPRIQAGASGDGGRIARVHSAGGGKAWRWGDGHGSSEHQGRSGCAFATIPPLRFATGASRRWERGRRGGGAYGGQRRGHAGSSRGAAQGGMEWWRRGHAGRRAARLPESARGGRSASAPCA